MFDYMIEHMHTCTCTANGNVVCAPLSIVLAYRILLAGARGKIAKQLLNAHGRSVGERYRDAEQIKESHSDGIHGHVLQVDHVHLL